MNALSRRERLRRVVLLCAHCVRNLTYYRATFSKLSGRRYSQILVTINSNFLDMAVIEWCKLFGDKKGKHYHRNAITDQNFEEKMLLHLNLARDDFESYVNEFRVYRDKFIAHLDDLPVMNIPSLSLAKEAAMFYHSHVVQNEVSTGDLANLPTDLRVYEQQCIDEALEMLTHCNL